MSLDPVLLAAMAVAMALFAAAVAIAAAIGRLSRRKPRSPQRPETPPEVRRSVVAVAAVTGGQVRAGIAGGFGTAADAEALADAIRAGREQRAADDELLRDLAAALREPEGTEASLRAYRNARQIHQERNGGGS